VSERILILGAGVMQMPAITIAKRKGWRVVVADVNPEAPAAGMGDEFVRVDLKDREGMERVARDLKESGGLDGVFTAGTDFSTTVAWVAERLGLPGIPYSVARAASDKEVMRETLAAAGVPQPRFAVIRLDGRSPGAAASEAPVKAGTLGFPLVVKPVDNMGARGVRRVSDEKGLVEACASALSFSRSGRAIVEEYMDGPEFSIDALVSDGVLTVCGFADRHIFFPPCFIEMGHTIPSGFPSGDVENVLGVFSRGVKALGIGNGAAKGDMKLTSAGPMVGEIAARLSGGYMSGWTYPYCSGVEPTSGALEIAVGRKPGSLEPTKREVCAERAFISIPGVVRELVGLEKARSLPDVRDVFGRVAAGDRVVFPVNNVEKCGNVIASNPDRERAIGSAEGAARSILIRLEAGNGETASFLSRQLGPSSGRPSGDGAGFPPPAYRLSPETHSGLSSMPPRLEGNRDSGRPASGPGTLSAPVSVSVLPFPAIERETSLDWQGRSIKEGLEAVRRLTGVAFSTEADIVLGSEFWHAFLAGGYQGGAWAVDTAAAKASSGSGRSHA
jgi:biotin carboxylase